MKYTKMITLSFTFLALSGCSDRLTPEKVCQAYPEMCEDINKDGWCQAERSILLLARYAEKQRGNSDDKFDLLIAFENYKSCIDPISNIEPKNKKEKKQQRMKGFITSVQEITRLVNETKNSDNPKLLMYHWSREQDQTALKKLLTMEGTGALDSSALQMGLAEYYIKFDQKKAIQKMFRALELSKPGFKINTEILTSISSIHFNIKDYSNAYVWARVAMMNGSRNVNLEPIVQMLVNKQADIKSLDIKAEAYFEEISIGTFKAPKQ